MPYATDSTKQQRNAQRQYKKEIMEELAYIAEQIASVNDALLEIDIEDSLVDAYKQRRRILQERANQIELEIKVFQLGA